VLSNQNIFRQKASNPQSSLQPWLEQLLHAPGLVRCYATEDPNPTKQLKNKLSQAAAAREGLLVLLLADENSFLKAREALLERWMSNAEWPKSVAAVALAHPLASPAIAAVIERTENPWASRIRRSCFPEAQLITVTDKNQMRANQKCSVCGYSLPIAARFCPECGRPINALDKATAVEESSTT
jgi:hypothetical protein